MTRQDRSQVSRILQGVAGKVVHSVRRVFFVAGGVADRKEGPFELEFEDGSVIRFQSGTNGQDLIVVSDRWHDPFSGDLSQENRSYVDQYGKWSLFDVSDEEPYVRMRGKPILEVQEIDLEAQSIEEEFPLTEAAAKGWNIDPQTIIGVVLVFDGHAVRVESRMDELHVETVPNMTDKED